MLKVINIQASKYSIEYDPAKQWDYRIKRGSEDLSKELKTNVMNDLVFCLTENIEKGVVLEGITVSEKQEASIMSKKFIRREFDGSVEEAKMTYKIGQVVEINGHRYKVDSIEDAVASTCFMSFPSVYFKLAE